MDTDIQDQRWNALVQQFCGLSDRLGMPIDDDIFETVIAFNALGITTTASCSGHITRDAGHIRYPWIDFCVSDRTTDTLLHKQEQLRTHAHHLQSKLHTQQRKQQHHPKRINTLQKHLRKAWQAYHAHTLTLRIYQVPLRRRVVEYLDQFYKDRTVPFDCRLTLRLIGHHTRLESQGADDFYLNESREFQLHKLAAYRAEMQAFTEFLKACYRAQQEHESPLPTDTAQGS